MQNINLTILYLCIPPKQTMAMIFTIFRGYSSLEKIPNKMNRKQNFFIDVLWYSIVTAQCGWRPFGKCLQMERCFHRLR